MTRKLIEIPDEWLSCQNKDVQAVIGVLSDHIWQQDNRIAKLEARLGIHPSNSSVPPSSQHPHAKIPTVKPKSKRKRGSQQGHKKSKRELVPIESVDQVIPCIPAACRRCGGELIGRDSEPLRDQVYELPEIKPDIIEYQRHRLCCPKCGITTCGTLPEGVPTQSAGPRLTAFVSLLMAHYRQSNAGRACFSNRLSDKRTHNNQQSRILPQSAFRGVNEYTAETLTRSDAELKATAYHEAGHAVMAILLGRPVEKVTIAAGQLQSGISRLGACKIQKGRHKASRDPMEDEVLILLAGMVAESRVTGRYCQLGASQDLLLVESLLSANRATNERQLQRLAQRLVDKTENLLNGAEPSKAIELIANELIEKETISGRAVRHFLDIAKQQCS